MADALRGNRDAAFVTTVNVNGRTEQDVFIPKIKGSGWQSAALSQVSGQLHQSNSGS